MISTQALLASAKNRPNHLAMIDGEKRITYREMFARVTRLAGALEASGVRKGDRVGILLFNESRYLELLFGITMLGAVAVPINTRLSAPEVTFILNDADAKLLFFHREFLPMLTTLQKEAAGIERFILCEDGGEVADTTIYEAFMQEASPIEDVYRVCENDLAGIFYTGGTTGMPKGVMLTHRNLMSNAYNFAIALEFTRQEIYLHAAPMYHLADGCSTFGTTVVGGTHIFMRMFDPVKLLALVERERVTSMILVPTMINMLIHTPSLSDYDVSSLRKILYGASPCPTEVLRKAMTLLPVRYYQGYGQTEAAPLLTILSAEDHVLEGEEHIVSRLTSAGQPLPGVQVRVVNAKGEDVAPGEVGEVIAKGPNVMAGYWKRPEETAATIVNGWLYTGDMATVDGENFIYIVDRKKDMIVTGGENVYSVEVENVIYTHPAVLEAAVVAVPDEKWGESVKAVVVLKKDCTVTEEELIEHCRRDLAGYKVPKSVDFAAELPKSGPGKILKRSIRDHYWSGMSRQVN
ncbi:long-chain-fatty-acid--CoA ligase [Brevibacillus dissolubilis]|uniref:long-chain-fatty-acid--CoA ligase n=1 Tax=Brevibacillus dissolubilis TaxID=1844116 RepID=UPI0011177623|nr:long-chain-fatty-acid--CoA ligase [Brevibacillus dissolubilis]